MFDRYWMVHMTEITGVHRYWMVHMTEITGIFSLTPI